MTLKEITDMYPEPYRTKILHWPLKYWRMDTTSQYVSQAVDNVSYDVRNTEENSYWSNLIRMMLNHEKVCNNKM